MIARNRIRRAVGDKDCIEAFFFGTAFAPHRHDTYTFAMTTKGVQSFNYRGSLRHSMPGEIVILHPDEIHDGRAGTEDGFGYKSICIMPSEIQQVIEGRPLPFIEGGISKNVNLMRVLKTLLNELDHPLDNTEYEDAIFDLAAELERQSSCEKVPTSADYRSAELARQFIEDNIFEPLNLERVETEVNQNRWQLSRDFRRLFGTSPYRYLVMRRLDHAKHLILSGQPLCDVATACLFSDQSHFCRHFKKTFGMSPQVWQKSIC